MKQKILFAVLLLNAIFSIAVLCLYGCLEDRQLEVMASIAGDRCRHGGGKYGNGGCVPVLRTADGFMFEAVGILIPPPAHRKAFERKLRFLRTTRGRSRLSKFDRWSACHEQNLSQTPDRMGAWTAEFQFRYNARNIDDGERTALK